MPVDGVDAVLLDPLDPGVQAGDAGQVRRAVFHAVGVLVQVVALGALAPRCRRRGCGRSPRPSRTYMPPMPMGPIRLLWPVKQMTSAPRSSSFTGTMPRGLADVQDQVDAPLAAGLADGGHVLHGADDVGAVVHDHRR